ncbi:hypothetical protein KKE48_02350 [Patescibacteria group bacterium]|nr:hypothetical protein [Patescibacteria group bacterium]
MKEQEKQLKPGEYHATEAEKVMAVGSGLVIGGVVASEIAIPTGSAGSTVWFEVFRTAVAAGGGFSASLGLLDVLRHRGDARKASGEGKK